MAPLTQWTWIWANSRRWWRTGEPKVLQFLGSQTDRHNWGTKHHLRVNETTNENHRTAQRTLLCALCWPKTGRKSKKEGTREGTAGSLCRTVETNTAPQSNHTSVKINTKTRNSKVPDTSTLNFRTLRKFISFTKKKKKRGKLKVVCTGEVSYLLRVWE